MKAKSVYGLICAATAGLLLSGMSTSAVADVTTTGSVTPSPLTPGSTVPGTGINVGPGDTPGQLTISNGSELNVNADFGYVEVSQGTGAGPKVPQSSLTVTGGGKLNINTIASSVKTDEFGGVYVGTESDANGSVIVSGPGSSIQIQGNDNEVAVGISGNGTLRVENGGSIEGALFLDAALYEGSTGNIQVDGTGSKIVLQGVCKACPGANYENEQAFMSIGSAANSSGEVSVSNGGQILFDPASTSGSGTGFWLGGDSDVGTGGFGRLNVDGKGSEVRVKGDSATFSVGSLGGTGELNVTNGGQVILENPDGKATGYVGDRIGSNGNSVTVDGTGSLLDAGSLLAVGLDQDLNDAGDGVVTVSHGGALRAEDIVVGANGTLRGDGILQGTVTAKGGTVSPGLSPGTLTIDGDFIFDGGVLDLEADSLSALDHIVVTGNATFSGGVIDIFLGFTPDSTYLFDFFDVTGVIDIQDGFGGFRAFAKPGSGVVSGTSLLVGLGGREFQTSVPEPGSLALLATGLAAVRLTRRGFRLS